jgi:putative ABC transport system permease protein
LNDLRVALRQYLREPGFVLTITVTLALTIGATTAVYSVVSTVLLRALPFALPHELVWIASVRSDNPGAPFSLPEFMDYRSRTRTLAGLAAYANWSASLSGDGVTERFQGARISANAFDLLGVTPAAGRLLNERDDRPDAPPVVVLSHRLWQQRYGGALEIVGKTARINGEAFVIAGVLPPQFPLPLRDIDIMTPLVPDRDPLRHLRNSVNFLRVFGRLRPGADAGQAQRELTAICRSLREQFPVEYARKESVRIVALHETLVGDHRPALLIVLAAVVAVLGTALANLLSLALVRASGRRGELTTRIALGASRSRLARQLTLETLLLTLCGSGAGWLVASQAIAATRRWAPPSVPRLGEVGLDSSAALLVVIITGGVTMLLAAAPIGVAAATQAGNTIRASTRSAIGDRWNQRFRNAMVVAEICAALVLVLATGLLVQNLRELQSVNPGFRTEGVFQARVSIPSSYRTAEDVTRFYEHLAERVAAAPGVTQVGVTSVAPLSGLLAMVPFSVAGRPFEDRDRPSANLRAISPGFLPVVGTRLLQGRLFDESDRAGALPVALVSAALADRFFAGSAVGRRLMIDDNNTGPRAVDVVGVVENVRQAALDLPPVFDVYVPLRQVHPDGVSFIRNNQFWMVRTGSGPAAFRETFLELLRAVYPDAAVSGAGTMRQFVDAGLGPRRFNLGLFAAFALTALLLAGSGLYGLVSYTVSQRTPEIGLRMALGASPLNIQRMILRQAAALGLTGAAAGVGLIAAAPPLMSRIVSDVRISPAVMGTTAAFVIAIVLMAAWLPARRAARIEPSMALRGE